MYWKNSNKFIKLWLELAIAINENITTIIGICLLIGAMAKSSQVGLHI
jgi:NADH-ubiquinone oxidoreductase chain 5